MKTCREFRQYFREDLTSLPGAEVKPHLADCPYCAREYRLIRLEHKLLKATLPGEQILELSPDFLVKLRARRRRSQPSEKGVLWELIWSFSKPFAIVAMVLLLFVGGLNLYAISKQGSEPLRVERYMVGQATDDLDLILAEDLTLTQDRVLGTLVAVRGNENANQQ